MSMKTNNAFYTNTAYDKDFGCPSITVPARQFLLAGQSRIVTGILRWTTMSVTIVLGTHVLWNG